MLERLLFPHVAVDKFSAVHPIILQVEKEIPVFIIKRNNSNPVEIMSAICRIYSSFTSVFLNVLKGSLEGVNNKDVHGDYLKLPTEQIIELGFKSKRQRIFFQILYFFHCNKF